MLKLTAEALRRTTQARARHERHSTRSNLKDWQVKRRERTRQLIELGGLVAKAGLIELTGDDRAVIYGGLLAVAERLKGDDREQALLLWERRGRRAFDQDTSMRD